MRVGNAEWWVGKSKDFVYPHFRLPIPHSHFASSAHSFSIKGVSPSPTGGALFKRYRKDRVSTSAPKNLEIERAVLQLDLQSPFPGNNSQIT